MSNSVQPQTENLVFMAQTELDKDRGPHTLLRAWTTIIELRHLAEWGEIHEAMTRVAHVRGFENRSHRIWQYEDGVRVYVIYLFNPRASLT